MLHAKNPNEPVYRINSLTETQHTLCKSLWFRESAKSHKYKCKKSQENPLKPGGRYFHVDITASYFHVDITASTLDL